MVPLENAVHHVFAFVLNGKVAHQLLRRDELWILDQEVGLALRKLMVSSGVGGQVLTWRLDGEGSGLNEIILAAHTGSSSISLLLVLMLAQVQLLLAAACSGTAGLLLPAHQTTRPLVKPASTCARISSSPLLKVRVCLKALLPMGRGAR